MAFTPTDPTKAEVKVIQEGEQLEFDFYIPRGAKGEPGGIALGADLGGANLNGFKTSGVYRQTNSGNASLLNNYPIANHAGNLVVLERVPNSTLTQIFYPILLPETTYVRNMNGLDVWGSWKCHTSTRFDQSAGRAAYTYDYLNSREQLTYGDTGWRNLPAAEYSTMPGATGGISIRRQGATVQVAVSLSFNDGASGAILNIPAGFWANGIGPTYRFTRPSAALTQVTYRLGPNSIGHSAPTWNTGFGQLYIHETWTTTDAWPTTLPGVASGGIPNL